jgi:hypothetical protein
MRPRKTQIGYASYQRIVQLDAFFPCTPHLECLFVLVLLRTRHKMQRLSINGKFLDRNLAHQVSDEEPDRQQRDGGGFQSNRLWPTVPLCWFSLLCFSAGMTTSITY